MYSFFLLLLFYNALIFVSVFGSNVKLVLEGVLFCSTCCKGRVGLLFVSPFNCMTSSELLLSIFFSYYYYVHIKKIINIPNSVQNVLSIIIDYIKLFFLLSNLGSPWHPNWGLYKGAFLDLLLLYLFVLNECSINRWKEK